MCIIFECFDQNISNAQSKNKNTVMFLCPRQNVRWMSNAVSAARKEKVVVLGVGWGGFRLAKDLDKSKFDVTIVSPRNHFLFTPLLPSTTVGTLEFRLWKRCP